MRRFIPHIFTFLNLFCGLLAIILATQNQLVFAAYLVFAGIFFDFFDGFTARLLKVESELGVQLDSLADMVTSGVVPGVVMFQLFYMSSENFYEHFTWNNTWGGAVIYMFSLIGFLIPLGAAYRLAKFNIDENQTTSFVGLPTPANAILIVSLPLILEFQNSPFWNSLVLNCSFLLIITVLSTFMMNAPIELFALKFKHWKFKENAYKYIFLLGSLFLLVFFKIVGVLLVIIWYIFLSLILNIIRKSPRKGL